MDANTLGKHFDGTVHLSNDINCTPKNMDLYLDQKGDVGPGCCRPISWLCDWIAANRADVPSRDVAADPPHLPSRGQLHRRVPDADQVARSTTPAATRARTATRSSSAST